MTEGYPFRFAGAGFIARPSGALWWPDRRMLVVADLHLGRAERYARRGGALLPPFEVQDTLERLASEIAALDPARVVSLGDAFDDDPAAHHIGAKDAALLRDMARDRDWIWISGNHDPGRLPANLSGVVVPDLPGAITLRHQAGEGPDISGHMHPSTRLAGRRFRCFVVGAQHLICRPSAPIPGVLISPILPLPRWRRAAWRWPARRGFLQGLCRRKDGKQRCAWA